MSLPADFDCPSERGLIFDCDGTLADTMPLHYVSWQDVMNRHGVVFEEARFYALAGQPTAFIIEQLLAEQSVAGDVRLLAEEKDAVFHQLMPKVQPIAPVVAIVRRYQGKRPMAVGSGSTRDGVQQILAHLGLRDVFDAIVGAEDVDHPKPAPDVFLRAAEQMGVSPEDCRVYEDGDLGIQAARRAGMAVSDVRTVFQPRRLT